MSSILRHCLLNTPSPLKDSGFTSSRKRQEFTIGSGIMNYDCLVHWGSCYDGHHCLPLPIQWMSIVHSGNNFHCTAVGNIYSPQENSFRLLSVSPPLKRHAPRGRTPPPDYYPERKDPPCASQNVHSIILHSAFCNTENDTSVSSVVQLSTVFFEDRNGFFKNSLHVQSVDRTRVIVSSRST